MSRYRKRSLPELIQESSREKSKNDNMETLTNILFIIFWIIVIKYINDLEKNCKCSDNWKRDFIKYSLIIFIIFILLKVIFKKKLHTVNKIILFLIILLNFIFTFVVLFYINELKNNECRCSESDIRTALEIVNYIRLVIMCIGLLAFIYLFYKLKKNSNLYLN
jgi:prepilin signal peptidase PulO-like enzyme (type II secretory pathway)